MGASSPVLPMTAENMERAAEIIQAGDLVAFATETVYGLGGDATNGEAVAKIFTAKGRPSFNPLISHVADIDAVAEIGELNGTAQRVAEAFWPGPLTMVLKKSASCPVADLTTAGLNTVAVRVPRAEPARAFLRTCGVPVAAPSANASGGISPTMAKHVHASLPGPDDGGSQMILDGGPCDVGLESSVLDLSTEHPTLLRPGSITTAEIEALIGSISEADTDDHAPKSPGMLSRHYAPSKPLRMNALNPADDEFFIGFGDVGTYSLNLSPAGDLTEAAANLFQMLHQADASDAQGIAVAPIIDVGLGQAINDRLRRGSKN